MEEKWVLNVLKSCRHHGVPFFFKQWGGINKKKNGRELRGKTYDEFPVVKNPPTPSRTTRKEKKVAVERKLQERNELFQIVL
jgi:hypothetical protein